MPVFSHDEFLITITQQSQSIQTALWLNDSLQEMTEREMDPRTRAGSMQMGEVLEEIDRADDQYQCAIWKVFCYLLQITCPCTTKVVCIDHVNLPCKRPPANHVLRKRFSDTELRDIQAKVSERASVSAVWHPKLKKLLDDNPCPPLNILPALFSEGERIQFPLQELNLLRKCVNKASGWLEAANVIIIRKPTRNRMRRSRGRSSTSTIDNFPSSGVGEEIIDKPDRSLDDLYALLTEVEHLGLDVPEITQLKAIASEAEDTRKKVRALLDVKSVPRDRELYVQECKRLILHAATLNILVDDIVEVEKTVMREQLLKELEEDLEDDNLTLDDVRQLVARAQACNLPLDNPYMERLQAFLRYGIAWEDRVKKLQDKPQRSLEFRVGSERIKGAYAYQTLLSLSRDGVLPLGSDHPVESINPLLGFYAAVARLDIEGKSPPRYPAERLTRVQALKGVTLDAAYTAFTEDRLGSLSPGKRADFVVLDHVPHVIA